eukprot:8797245-Pyramimonas_sp.AAC.1
MSKYSTMSKVSGGARCTTPLRKREKTGRYSAQVIQESSWTNLIHRHRATRPHDQRVRADSAIGCACVPNGMEVPMRSFRRPLHSMSDRLNRVCHSLNHR